MKKRKQRGAAAPLATVKRGRNVTIKRARIIVEKVYNPGWLDEFRIVVKSPNGRTLLMSEEHATRRMVLRTARKLGALLSDALVVDETEARR